MLPPTKVLVIDDEAIACAGLLSKLQKIDISLELTTTTSAIKGLEIIQSAHPPDIVFLDISMPHMSGFDLLDQLSEEHRKFSLIFCTAHSEFALQAFDTAAIDYILKPAAPERIKGALDRCRNRRDGNWSNSFEELEKPALAKISVKTRRGIELIDVNDILFFSSESHETIAWLRGEREFICQPSLNQLTERLKEAGFYRVHRSCLVNTSRIKSIDTQKNAIFVEGSEQTLPLSKRIKADFLRNQKSK